MKWVSQRFPFCETSSQTSSCVRCDFVYREPGFPREGLIAVVGGIDVVPVSPQIGVWGPIPFCIPGHLNWSEW